MVSLLFGILGARFSFKNTFAAGAFLQAGGLLLLLSDNYVLLIVSRIVFAVGPAITVLTIFKKIVPLSTNQFPNPPCNLLDRPLFRTIAYYYHYFSQLF
jgi:MFS family permease